MSGVPITITPSSFQLLQELQQHNNREWFLEHKDLFAAEQKRMAAFADVLLQDLNRHDVIETASGKDALQRMNRDIRFSKDKRPYKGYWGGGFRRATRKRRGGYYFHIEPGNKTFVGGGFWGPNAADLKRIREDIAFDPAPLQQILNDKLFIRSFGKLAGEQLKTAPKGFDAAHEAIELLRYKQYLLLRRFDDATVLRKDFSKLAGDTFRQMRPFLDYMSEVLSTDVNGLEL